MYAKELARRAAGFADCVDEGFGLWDATHNPHEQHLQEKRGSILTRAWRARTKHAESYEGRGDVGKCPETWGYAPSRQ